MQAGVATTSAATRVASQPIHKCVVNKNTEVLWHPTPCRTVALVSLLVDVRGVEWVPPVYIASHHRIYMTSETKARLRLYNQRGHVEAVKELKAELPLPSRDIDDPCVLLPW